MKNCPHKKLCDINVDRHEAYNEYVFRHANDHGMDFPSQTSIDDVERNLALYCGYYGHKYIIGNKTLIPDPHWEVHEFVFNWHFHPDDLESGLWDEPDPAVAEGYTFELKPYDERLPGIYKRFKEVELPRGVQKTSIVSKAYVTLSHLQQRFLFDNITHRIIITSATTTLTEGVTESLRAVWEKNRNIKRLFGIDRFRTVMKRGEPVQAFLRRDGIYGKKGRNTLLLRWTKDSEDATGLNAFSVLYAGIATETQGQRADEYVFDDGNTKKNSKKQARREEVVECFVEQVNQLDPMGRLIVCNTRQHLEDFGGKIKTPEYRQRFHILHRRAIVVDPVTKQDRAYYPVDGTGRERYSLAVLKDMFALKPEHEVWSEYMNCPRDPKKQIFTASQFQVVAIDDPRIMIEIRAGLGNPLTPAERMQLEQERVSVSAYNTCDPAGKEEQSARGDSTWIGGHRFDRFGNWVITYLAYGQWDSDRTWHENYLAYAYNRPIAHDYELPASELHIRSSFEAWKANYAAKTNMQCVFFIDFDHMPKGGKPHRIEGLVPWTKNGKVYIVKSAAPPEVIAEFIRQFHSYPVVNHDDAPDMMSRCLRYVQAPSFKQLSQAAPADPTTRMKDGVFVTTGKALLDSFKGSGKTKSVNWGRQGSKRRDS